ncbi:sodium/glutamate symporter [Salipiger bermudensis]|uniref:sodium/glutamate symporter n=1 Tax=Salipiger bermudensis TaxID=344736 RepID=UPI001C992F01|nr:sodium/glutamate symporter [Salipiger bermudensis]MBY6002750.1 sodium/glutamate symporter [Salipiger bermudensis]
MIVPAFLSATIGMLVYFIGVRLTEKIAFLRDFNIPEPVSGGLAVSLLTLLHHLFTGTEIDFDLSGRDYLLLVFFSTIGLNARLSDLMSAGKVLFYLALITVAFLVIQNAVGLAGAALFGLPLPASVLLGSAALIGGHGTAIAWGPYITELTGVAGMAEMGLATATLGLVLAALLGGPVAKILIERNRLEGPHDAAPMVGLEFDDEAEPAEAVNHVNLMRSILVAHIAIMIGYLLHAEFTAIGLDLPLFVPCLMAGILLSNTVPLLRPKLPWPARTPALAVLSDFSLSLFLAMSLMSMQLWTLAGLGGPLATVLLVQVLATVVGVLFVFFPLMGRDYTAAVLSAGFVGFTLGATPTAIANMSSVTKRYGAAPLAFIVLPLISAFFVDLANALVIQLFVSL